jgi:hypothetical protein
MQGLRHTRSVLLLSLSGSEIQPNYQGGQRDRKAKRHEERTVIVALIQEARTLAQTTPATTPEK